MSVWLEIHCDVRAKGRHQSNTLRPLCRSDENENPMGMAKNASRVPAVLRLLERDAVKRGWRKRAGKWACSGCATQPAPSSGEVAK